MKINRFWTVDYTLAFPDGREEYMTKKVEAATLPEAFLEASRRINEDPRILSEEADRAVIWGVMAAPEEE